MWAANNSQICNVLVKVLSRDNKDLNVEINNLIQSDCMRFELMSLMTVKNVFITKITPEEPAGSKLGYLI